MVFSHVAEAILIIYSKYLVKLYFLSGMRGVKDNSNYKINLRLEACKFMNTLF